MIIYILKFLLIKARAYDRDVCVSGDVHKILKFVLNQTKNKRFDFYSFADSRILYMKSQGRFGNADAYQSAVDQFKIVFPELFFEQINSQLLEQFKEFKKTFVKELKDGTLKRVKNITIRGYLHEIRAIYNAGLKRLALQITILLRG